MKFSFTGKLRLIIMVLFLISMVQGIIVLHLVITGQDMHQVRLDIQNTIYITLFMQFLVTIILVFYIPVFLHKAFMDIHVILKDIAQGMYSMEIDLPTYESMVDKEIFAVIKSISHTLRSVKNFDKLKKDKIVEHHNRIISILNLAENGFIIVDVEGNIVYINDKLTDIFPNLSEGVNITETNFTPEIENSIKKFILPILKSKSSIDNQQYFMPTLKRHIGLTCGIVRDSYGGVKGTVVAVTNLEAKKKVEKKDNED